MALAIWSDIPSAQDEVTVWESVTPLLLAVSQKESSTFMDEETVKQVLTTYFKK